MFLETDSGHNHKISHYLQCSSMDALLFESHCYLVCDQYEATSVWLMENQQQNKQQP